MPPGSSSRCRAANIGAPWSVQSAELGGSVILKIDADNKGPRGQTDNAAQGQDARAVVFVLMAGGFSPPPLGTAVGCSVLDLRLTREQSVLDRWQWAVSTLDRAGVAGERLCLCGGSTALPEHNTEGLRVIVDQSDYRGPAGALRDACERLAPGTTIIAAEAARCCTIDLARMLARHKQTDADVTVGRNSDQSPAGVYILERATLDQIPHAGFMDLKEQWLAKLVSAGRNVRVHQLREDGALPLRSRAEFLAAMHACNDHAAAQATGSLEPRVLRDTRCANSVVCEDTQIAPDAVIVDSLIMPGATIDAGALVARSIVGAGRRVAAGEVIVDAVVGPSGVSHDGPGRRGDSR